MNILYINHYAGGPSYGMEYRPYYMAREWVRAGHRVTVVAANFSHVRAGQPQANERNAERIALDGDRKAQMDRMDRLYRELLP